MYILCFLPEQWAPRKGHPFGYSNCRGLFLMAYRWGPAVDGKLDAGHFSELQVPCSLAHSNGAH